MWQSQTLPRLQQHDISEPFTATMSNYASATLHKSSRSVDVNQLREDIEELSRQLNMVRSQLDSQLVSDRIEETPITEGTIDSRLSTALFSPVSHRSRDTPTPQPTRLSISIGNPADSLRKNNLSLSTSFLSSTAPISTNKRMSVCVPSSSIVVPRVKRRETFAKADSRPTTIRQERLKRADSCHNVAPPKPVRTFAETLDLTLQKRLQDKANESTTYYLCCPLVEVPDKSIEEIILLLKDRFINRQCWFLIKNEIIFLNPFNDISASKQATYNVISTIASSLLERSQSAIVMRGISGSGKTQLGEMICLVIMNRLHTRLSTINIFTAAVSLLRCMMTINIDNNNQSSRAVLHYELQTRDNRLSKIVLHHFFLESPSRGCKANVFAMLANDMNEADKERYRISGFQLRDNYTNYGSLDNMKMALNVLGISVTDVLTVLSACTLLNNLIFKEIKGYVDIENLRDLEDASHLLGLSSLSLYRTLMNGTASNITISESRRTRDQLVSAIYYRLLSAIVRKTNQLLDSLMDVPEDDSCFNDSGIGLSGGERNIIHVVDVPGYIRTNNNSLTELLINTVNDILESKESEACLRLLRNVNSGKTSSDSIYKKNSATIEHSGGDWVVEYDTSKLANRNRNTISQELVSLFDERSCSFDFVVSLFVDDMYNIREDPDYVPQAILWRTCETSVTNNVLECTKKLQMCLMDCQKRYVNCVKTNDRLEYARFNEKMITEQLNRLMVKRSSSLGYIKLGRQPSSESSTPTVLQQPIQPPDLPPRRMYEIKDGKKYLFPQRRTIVVDFIDNISGVSLRGGEVVKAIGFDGDCYVIETGRRQRALVPITFTEKSLPPTEAYCV